jgi:hypothetical protein
VITPGKWYVVRGPAVMAEDPDDPSNTRGVADCRTVDVDEQSARDNARLIAAAKELLDACIEVDACGNRLPSKKVRAQVMQAIRKALSGEAPHEPRTKDQGPRTNPLLDPRD